MSSGTSSSLTRRAENCQACAGPPSARDASEAPPDSRNQLNSGTKEQEGISIPYPQRDVHLIGGQTGEAT